MKRKSPWYFISAGEFSGDLLAADLVNAIRDVVPRMKPFGLAGEAMKTCGVEPIAEMHEFNVMGIWEVVRKLPEIAMSRKRILHAIDLRQPAFAVLVDFPGFHMALAEDLKMRGIPVFQYVAPKLWAWGEGRAAKLRENYEEVLGVLPFEEEFFKKRQVPYTYVGSPHRDRVSKVNVTAADLGLPPGVPIVAMLAGSRPAELRNMLPILVNIARYIKQQVPDALFLFPVALSLTFEQVEQVLGDRLEDFSAGSGVAQEISRKIGAKWFKGMAFFPGMSLETMSIADVAVVTSGTATLECALAGTPMSVVYLVGGISYAIMRRIAKVQYISLVNLMLNRPLIREFLQEFTPSEVANDVVELLKNDERRQTVLDGFEELKAGLSEHAAYHAAKAIVTRISAALPISSNLRP